MELDVLGIGYDAITGDQRQASVEAHPRPDFKNWILEAFHGGLKERPEATFGNVKADVLDHFESDFQCKRCVEVVKNSDWSESSRP